MSSENSPLLPSDERQANPNPQDRQIFLRICHATWHSIGSNGLLASRAIIMTYMAVVWGFALEQDVSGDYDARLFPFYLENISYTLQIAYFAVSSFWCLQHFMSPRNRPQRDRQSGLVGQVLTVHQRAFSLISIPRTTEFTEVQRFLFSVFYAAAQTYPFLVTLLHYCFLGDRDGTFVTGDTKRDWISFSLYAANSGAALIETLFLSGVRQLEPFAGHCLALAASTGLYFAWAYAGYAITGSWTYTQVDPEHEGTEGMFVNVVTSMALTLGMFLAVMGIHQVRVLVARLTGFGKSY